MKAAWTWGLAFCWLAQPALAGPPYVTDDPETTDYKHYEIYAFADGVKTRDGKEGEAGVDFNYGATPDLQLTAVLPLAYERDVGARTVDGLGNVELAAKLRVLHQDKFGWDVAVFPRVFLPSGSHKVGDRHGALLLPVWVGKTIGKWSTFGGGGCELNRGGGALGWALTRDVTARLHAGAEIYHQSADTKGGEPTSGLGAGVVYDLSPHYHLLASAGPGIQNAAETDRNSWYAAMLFTF